MDTQNLLLDQHFYNPEAFPYFFMKDKSDPIVEDNLQFDDFILQTLRTEIIEVNIDILKLLNTFTDIYKNTGNPLLIIRSILLLFALKNIINVYPFFSELLTEDGIVENNSAYGPSHLMKKENKYFTEPFFNELSKHRLLMLDVVESIHQFANSGGLQYERIYPIINNIIKANENSLTPLNSNQLNFMEAENARKFKKIIYKSYPIIMPFSIKFKDYFKEKLPELKIYFTVNRDNILQTVWDLDSIENININIRIAFSDEDGIDCGGLTKEFIELAFKEICKPESDLFDLRDNYYWFKYHSQANVLDKEYLLRKYYCVGLFLGIVVLNKRSIPVHFPRYFYKKLLHRKIDRTEIKYFDSDIFNSLNALINSEVTEDSLLDYTFYDSLGHYEIDLRDFTDVTDKDDFEPEPLVDANKEEYYSRIADWIFNISIKEEFEEFEKGFLKVRHNPMLYKCFRLDEIDLIISGTYEHDWESLKKGAKYYDYEPDSQNIVWFWQYFDSLNEESKLNVLKFITASTSTPPGGLESLHITFQHARGKGLPIAHTCFNKIELPEYDSYEQLEKQCDIAFSYSESFGFG